MYISRVNLSSEKKINKTERYVVNVKETTSHQKQKTKFNGRNTQIKRVHKNDRPNIPTL